MSINYRDVVVMMATDCVVGKVKEPGLTKFERISIIRKYTNMVSDILNIRYDDAAELIHKEVLRNR